MKASETYCTINLNDNVIEDVGITKKKAEKFTKERSEEWFLVVNKMFPLCTPSTPFRTMTLEDAVNEIKDVKEMCIQYP